LSDINQLSVRANAQHESNVTLRRLNPERAGAKEACPSPHKKIFSEKGVYRYMQCTFIHFCLCGF